MRQGTSKREKMMRRGTSEMAAVSLIRDLVTHGPLPVELHERSTEVLCGLLGQGLRKKRWRSMTDDQIEDLYRMWDTSVGGDFIVLFRMFEDRLKELNK
jgi:hypothetical protein